MGLLLSTADRSFGLGLWLVTAQRLLNQGDKPQLDFYVTQQEGSVRQSFLFPPANNLPAYYIAEGITGWALALIDGCTTQGLAASLIAGYTPPFTGAGTQYVNSWADGVAQVVKNAMDGKLMSGAGVVTCSGHSGGGVVAQLLAKRIKAAYPNHRIRWQTFGQPKTGYIDAARAAATVPGVRWMWHLDPIPIVPLTFTDAPFLLPVVGLRTMISWSQFCHWEGGWQLVPGQTGHPEELPTGASVAPFTNLAAWLLSREAGSGTNHAIMDYEGFMIAESPYVPTQASNLRSVAPIETPPASDRRAETAAEQQVVESIVNAEHQQNAIPVALPDPQVFQAVRLGRIWIVTFGGVEVAISASRRGARGLARQMNDGLRRLQRSPVVDPTALGTQMQAYLAAAQDPAGGFRPVMNTTF